MALSRKHKRIIDKWFKNDADEIKLIKRYRISFSKLSKLLNTAETKDEIDSRMEVAKKRSRLLISKYLPLATAKLIELCNSENNETSRKACMDLIKEELQEKTIELNHESENKDEEFEEFDEETQSKLLEVLAESKKKNN